MKMRMILSLFGLMAVLAIGGAAQTTVVVTPPINTQGWSTADTRPGGAVAFVPDTTSGGNGALQLTTDISTTSKAQYMHAANTPLSSVTELSYWTKQNAALIPEGDPSYQLPVCLGGFTTPTPTNPTGCVGFTTFVYEPYWNGLVIPSVWQQWDVDSGQFWSSRSYSDGSCVVLAGGGGPPFYTLSGLKTACPNAVVTGFGVNIGSNNPGYNVETDFVNFNGTTYDFEMFAVASNKDQCKNGGWQSFRRADGSVFKNQGDCVSYTNNGR